jgi:photosystem II stability/assembly factor-like uncharacterized protein
LLSGYLSWRQPAPGQNDPATSFLQNPVKWLFYPVELNAQFRPSTWPVNWFFYPLAVEPRNRPPEIHKDLGAIAVAPGSNGKTLTAVGDLGTILRSTDGGATWTPQPSVTSEDLLAVIFPDSHAGWAVGDSGTILRTGNGGATWDPQPSGSSDDLWGVTFPNTQAGWAVGVHGSILHTADGGVSWNPQSTTSQTWLRAVTFLDARIGWIVGMRGTILHTADGGATWNQQPSGTTQDLTCVVFPSAQIGWAVGTSGIILHTVNGGTTWSPQPRLTKEDFLGAAFPDAQTGWAVGTNGMILHTGGGGGTWNREPSGSMAWLRGVTFLDAQTGWTVGLNGTILHTIDGGITWKPQEAFHYRRYPAPWFYLASLAVLPFLIWSLIAVRIPSTTIQESVTADAPVESLEDDRLGRRTLVERLSGFLQNPNTLPPLVLCLQAPWGMGKSSVMRMIQSTLEKNRAAATVWFNAWHHQKEDQLLAYLLETIQKEAVPQWLSRQGPLFRLNLIRVRLFDSKRKDRLALVILGNALIFAQYAFPGWLSAMGSFATGFTIGAPVVAAQHQLAQKLPAVFAAFAFLLAAVPLLLTTLPILDALIAFKSNPDKLADKAGGFLVDTFKELVRLPSLVGKSDVRQEFAENLQDVVAALKPRRLAIFLDDLDRCKPDQVVQILEAINFLSSVANCLLVVGADYEKVETLVATQFESLAVEEAENRTKTEKGLDKIELRVEYARNYLKKIVNLRLNLHPPADYKDLLKNNPPARKPRGWRFPSGSVLAATATLAVLALGVIFRQPVQTANQPVTVAQPTQQTEPQEAENGVAASAGPARTPKKPPAQAETPQQDGAIVRDVLSIGVPLLLGAGALLYRFNQPRKVEEAKDADTFTAALEVYSERIFAKYRTPREARRFLNYLRLVATGSGQKEGDALKNLRMRYPDRFDHDLVGLAVLGGVDTLGEDSEVKQYYRGQCELFGLDPTTFRPTDNGEGVR